ncbi:ParB/RepB/Spo0J family partition protein [Mariniblastus fucicola]|uniref:Putative chromosome-partitioning protein ParB n=1 Tax=Mariniblastus fucicola TaxID=980251 RepID=A0A5B9P6E4_9BACT|nr:ParB/RepB/Spo0J family partition protein [Mariniblastus fucicola]QEG21844.1 putative chromosome-partitioning protein ParB [Mariniblastus fucicola]
MTRKKRLGRGLEALLNSTEPDHSATIAVMDPGNNFIDRNHDGIPDGAQPEMSGATNAQTDVVAADRSRTPQPQIDSVPENSLTSDVVHLSVYEIEDNPFQPRREFSEPEIVSLSESLKEHDLMQPILVRVVDDRYQLISGERRLRAAIKANWQTIPARIRNADDRLVSELAIVENLQRKDLNAIEKALSFRRYIDEHRCTQEDLAKRLKIDRSTIANLMRLLELPTKIQTSVQTGRISAGHARALLPLGDAQMQQAWCDRIEREGLSVRAIEKLVAEQIADEEVHGRANAERARRSRDRQVEALQHELRMALGTAVKIKTGAKNRGQIVISFKDNDEFERLRELLLDGGAQ